MENAVTMPSQNSLLLRGLANILLGLVAIAWPGLTLYVLVIFFAVNIMFVGIVELFRPVIEKDSRHAVLTVILGILGIVVGLYLLANPYLSVNIIALLVAFWAVLFGLGDLMLGFADSSSSAGYRVLFVIVGVMSVIFGFYLIFYPAMSLLAFIWIVGVYALVTGVLYVIGSFIMPKAKLSKAKK